MLHVQLRVRRRAAKSAAAADARRTLRKETEWMRRQPKARSTKSSARIKQFYELTAKARDVPQAEVSVDFDGEAKMKRQVRDALQKSTPITINPPCQACHHPAFSGATESMFEVLRYPPHPLIALMCSGLSDACIVGHRRVHILDCKLSPSRAPSCSHIATVCRTAQVLYTEH